MSANLRISGHIAMLYFFTDFQLLIKKIRAENQLLKYLDLLSHLVFVT